MVIQHCPGKKHGNADGLSWIPEKEDFCNCYEAGISLSLLPCGGCAFCTKVHHQWARFEDSVDDVITLSICSASLTDDLSLEEILSTEFPLPQYSPDQLQKAQLKDPDLSKLVHWLEADEGPLINDLYLCSPAVKKFWLTRSQLKMQDGVLYYQWEDNPVKLLLIVPTTIRDEVLQGCHDSPTAGHLGQRKTLARVK